MTYPFYAESHQKLVESIAIPASATGFMFGTPVVKVEQLPVGLYTNELASMKYSVVESAPH